MMDWESIFEYWPEALFVIDSDGGFVFKNKAMSKLSPGSAQKLSELFDNLPDSVFSFIRGEETVAPEPFRAAVKLCQGPLCDLTLSGLPDGQRIMGALHLAEAADGGVVGKLEEGFQEIRKLGHDMCQPLTVIMGQTEIMQMIHAEDEEIGRRLSAILSEAEKMDAMIRKLSLLIQYRHQE